MEKQQCEGMQFYTVHVLSMTPSHTEVAIVGIFVHDVMETLGLVVTVELQLLQNIGS